MPAGAQQQNHPPAVAVVNRWYSRTDARPLQNLGLGLEEASLDKKPACTDRQTGVLICGHCNALRILVKSVPPIFEGDTYRQTR